MSKETKEKILKFKIFKNNKNIENVITLHWVVIELCGSLHLNQTIIQTDNLMIIWGIKIYCCYTPQYHGSFNSI